MDGIADAVCFLTISWFDLWGGMQRKSCFANYICAFHPLLPLQHH